MSKVTTLIDSLVQYEKEIRGFLMRRLGCQQLVADLYQDVAERVLKRPAQNCANPRAYLFQAAANAVVDHHRSEGSRRRLHSNGGGADAPDWTDHAELDARQAPGPAAAESPDLEERGPENLLLAHERVRIIEMALAEVPPLTRKIFYMYRLDGWSQQHIADHLDISRSTVERRLARAVAHWQKRLSQVEAGPRQAGTGTSVTQCPAPIRHVRYTLCDDSNRIENPAALTDDPSPTPHGR